jgi:hypothetical protein
VDFDLPKNPDNKHCICPNEKVKVFENFDQQSLNPGQQFIEWIMKRDSKKRFKTIAIAHNSAK